MESKWDLALQDTLSHLLLKKKVENCLGYNFLSGLQRSRLLTAILPPVSSSVREVSATVVPLVTSSRCICFSRLFHSCCSQEFRCNPSVHIFFVLCSSFCPHGNSPKLCQNLTPEIKISVINYVLLIELFYCANKVCKTKKKSC